MSSDLEELAAQGRKRRTAPKKGSRDAPRPRAKPRDPKLTEVAKVSLTTDSGTGVLFVALVACMAPVAVGKALDWPNDTLLAVIGASVAVAAVVSVVAFLTRGMGQLRWVRRVGFGLDASEYLSELGRSFQQAAMRVEVRFVQPVPEARRSVVADAALGASGAKRARFKGDLLVIESRSEKTYFHSLRSSASGSYHSNRALHAWFRKLVRKGLPVIDAEHPIAEIDVTIHGKG